MRGQIIKIHEPKIGKDGNQFIRVEFKMETGGWAKTDLCTGFRNWINWKWLLKEGRQLKCLELRRPGEINADCLPDIFQAKRSGHWQENPDKSMTWIEDSIEVKIEPN